LDLESPRAMNATTAKRHGLGGTLVRRWFTVFCMALFMLTNVGHAATCTTAHVHAAIADTAVAAPDHDSGTPKQTALDDNHCHGCIAVSVPAVTADASRLTTSTQIAPATAYRIDADRRPSDPPPPKSLI
jgi:hypothetical protein